MVAVEDRGNAVGMPARIFFAADRRSQREGRGQHGGLLKAEPIANDQATVIIFDPASSSSRMGSSQWSACHIALEWEASRR